MESFKILWRYNAQSISSTGSCLTTDSSFIHKVYIGPSDRAPSDPFVSRHYKPYWKSKCLWVLIDFSEECFVILTALTISEGGPRWWPSHSEHQEVWSTSNIWRWSEWSQRSTMSNYRIDSTPNLRKKRVVQYHYGDPLCRPAEKVFFFRRVQAAGALLEQSRRVKRKISREINH